jgi:hypothetical protein
MTINFTLRTWKQPRDRKESQVMRGAKKKSAPPKASRPFMPGYGLAKGTKGLLPWKWADEGLKKSHN